MTQLSIIFLGTGGSWPTLKRNVLSIAIKRAETFLDDGISPEGLKWPVMVQVHHEGA